MKVFLKTACYLSIAATLLRPGISQGQNGISVKAATVRGSDTVLRAEIRSQLANGAIAPSLYFPKSVKAFYASGVYQPVWIKPQGGTGPGWQAMLMIDCVLQFGLSHADYHPAELTYGRLHHILDTPGRVNPQAQARYEILLTDAVLTLMNHLHYGKLNSDYPSSRIDAEQDGRFSARMALSAALQQQDIMEKIAGVQPKAKAYTELQYQMHLIEGVYQDDCYEVPQAEVRKIAINMERLRWAEVSGSTYIHINIPSYTLRLYLKDTAYAFKVIVGKPSAPTPSLLSEIRYFTTAPEWRVPAKIFRKELLPKALADGRYLENNHFAIYDQRGRYIEPSRAALLQVRNHPELYFARQSAGCDNSLGSVVYRFANPYDIYLHDTPEQKLFKRSERAFSHGCIRVEQAEKLGSLLLQNDGSGDQVASFQQGMNAYIKRNFYLKKPVPIKVTYLTCGIDEWGYVSYPDIYGLDNSLEMALYGADALLNAQRK